MNQTVKKQYQRLQFLIWALQLEKWPFPEIEKTEVFKEVAQFSLNNTNLDITAPDFLPKLADFINKILEKPEAPAPNIPPNLQELLKEYEIHLEELKEDQQRVLRSIFPTLDEQIQALYEKYRLKIFAELQKIKSLADNLPLLEAISHRLALRLIQSLPLIAFEVKTAIETAISPERYQQYQKIIEKRAQQELSRLGIHPAPSTIQAIAENTQQEIGQLTSIPHATEITPQPIAVTQPPRITPLPTVTPTVIPKPKGSFLPKAFAGISKKIAGLVPPFKVFLFLKSLFDLFKSGFKKAADKPEATLATGISLLALANFVPLPPALKAIFTGSGLLTSGFGALTGAFKWMGKVTKFAGSLFTGTAKVATTLITGLATISAPQVLPIGALIIFTIILVFFLGFIKIINVSAGSFVPEGLGEDVPHFGEPVNPEATAHLAEAVIAILNQCAITHVTNANWSQAETCLQTSSLPNKSVIITRFRESTLGNNVLQCVGFVRGIMASLGKDPGEGRDAYQYLDPPTPAGYEPVNNNMNQVRVGDLAILRGGTDGHIVIVTRKEADSIIVAQTWGDTGLLEVSRVNPVYYTGFLRPR